MEAGFGLIFAVWGTLKVDRLRSSTCGCTYSMAISSSCIIMGISSSAYGVGGSIESKPWLEDSSSGDSLSSIFEL
jgi:hypothetical protein